MVLDSLGASAGDAEILLHQESNERWTLDPGPEWQISKLEVIEQDGGAQPRTQARMHRNLAGTPMAHSFLPMPECPRGGVNTGKLRAQTARRSPEYEGRGGGMGD